jgi:hypothetical protein
MELKYNRDNFLFNDSRAFSLILEGDQLECSRYIGYARQQLENILRLQDGSTSLSLKPIPDVDIRIDTRPNKIFIKSGKEINLYVTVVDKDSLSGFYPDLNNPPFQNKLSRFLYLNSSQEQTKNDFFAGGNRNYWMSDDKAISWNNFTVYIGGKFVTLTPPSGSYSIVTMAYAKLSNLSDLVTRFPVLADYDRVVFALCILSGTTLVLRIYVVNEVVGETFILGSLFVHQQTIDLPSEISPVINIVLISKFTYDAKKIAILFKQNFHQKIYVIEFNNDYSSNTKDLWLDEIYTHASGTASNSTDYAIDSSVELSTRTATSGLISGKPIIIDIKPEHNEFTLLQYKCTAFSSSYSGESAPSMPEGGESTQTDSITYHFQVSKLVKNDDSILGYSTDSFTSTSFIHGTTGTIPPGTFSVPGVFNSTSSENYIYVLFFSFEKNKIIYTHNEVIAQFDRFTSDGFVYTFESTSTVNYTTEISSGLSPINITNVTVPSSGSGSISRPGGSVQDFGNTPETFSVNLFQWGYSYENIKESPPFNFTTFHSNLAASNKLFVGCIINPVKTIFVPLDGEIDAFEVLDVRIDNGVIDTNQLPISITQLNY